MKPSYTSHRTIRPIDSDSINDDSGAITSTSYSLFNINGLFQGSLSTERNSFDSSVESESTYHDNQDSSTCWTEGDRSGTSMSEIYDARDVQSPERSFSYRRKINSLLRDFEVQPTIDEESTVGSYRSDKWNPRRLWSEVSVVRAPETQSIDEESTVGSYVSKNWNLRHWSDEASVVRAPTLSNEAKARVRDSKPNNTQTDLSTLVETCDGNSSKNGKPPSRNSPQNHRNLLKPFPQPRKDLASSKNQYSAQGFEISLMETREDEDLESNRKTPETFRFPWPKMIREEPEGDISPIENDGSDKSLRRESNTDAKDAEDEREMFPSKTIADEHRQDVAARVNRVARAALLQSLTDQSENSSATRSAIPAVLPKPEKKKKRPLNCSKSPLLWDVRKNVETSHLETTNKRESNGPSFAGFSSNSHRSKLHPEENRRPKSIMKTRSLILSDSTPADKAHPTIVESENALTIFGFNIDSLRQEISSFLLPYTTAESTAIPDSASVLQKEEVSSTLRKSPSQERAEEESIAERTKRIKKMLGMTSRRDHKNRKDLNQMVRKIKAKKSREILLKKLICKTKN